MDNSSQLWFRKQGHTDIAVGEAFESEKLGNISKYGMRGIIEADWIVMRQIWGWTKLSLKKQGLTGDKLISETARLTEEIVDKSQPTFEIETRPELAQSGAVGRLATMFMSGRNKTMQLYFRNLLDYEQSGKKLKDKSNLAYATAVIGIAIPLMHALLDELRRTALRKRKEELTVNDIMFGIMKKNIENFYGGQIPSYVVDKIRGKWGYEPNNPLNNVLTKGSNSIAQLIRAKDLEEILKGTDNVLKSSDILFTGLGYSGMREMMDIVLSKEKKRRRK